MLATRCRSTARVVGIRYHSALTASRPWLCAASRPPTKRPSASTNTPTQQKQQQQQQQQQLVNHDITSPLTDRILLLNVDGTKVGIVALSTTLREVEKGVTGRRLVQVGQMPCPAEAMPKGVASGGTSTVRIPVCRWMLDVASADSGSTVSVTSTTSAGASRTSASAPRASATITTTSPPVKREKELRLNSTIASHDLTVRRKKLRELLLKGHPVRVVLTVVRGGFSLHRPTEAEQARVLRGLVDEVCAKPVVHVRGANVDVQSVTSTGDVRVDGDSQDTDDAASYAIGARIGSPIRNVQRNQWSVLLEPPLSVVGKK